MSPNIELIGFPFFNVKAPMHDSIACLLNRCKSIRAEVIDDDTLIRNIPVITRCRCPADPR